MADPDSFSETEWQTCIKVLQVLSRRPEAALDVMTLKGLVTKLSRQAKKRLREEAARQDQALLSDTRLWQANAAANHPLRPPFLLLKDNNAASRRLHTPRSCYVCKRLFFHVHFHYHMHCPECAELHYAKRSQRADLRGCTALLTGGRIKIGWQTALRLLRDGAQVIITTRFPRNAAFRFGQELDFDEWRQRLIIHGLDLRDLAGLDQFIAELRNTELDILIHNAAQTIRRAPAFYEHLREIESRALPASEEALVHRCAVPAYDRFISGDHAWLPAGLLDSDGQQIDLSPANSWTARAGDVSTIELLETMLVSQSAPFLLSNRLRPQMARSSQSPRFIVNVSAMEGQFQRDSKTPCHPHTNMAKAALNMFTRTSAQDFMTDEIWMNSVDTGWITDENPFPKKTRLLDEHHFIPPLDAIDGMARIYDPIVRGRAEPKQKLFGQFLKDYQPHPW